MDPDTTALLRELADRSPSERDDYCAQHAVPAALRAEVESLLGFDDSAGDSPNDPVAAARLALAFDRTEARTIGAAAPTSDWFSGSAARIRILLEAATESECVQHLTVGMNPGSTGESGAIPEFHRDVWTP